MLLSLLLSLMLEGTTKILEKKHFYKRPCKKDAFVKVQSDGKSYSKANKIWQKI